MTNTVPSVPSVSCALKRSVKHKWEKRSRTSMKTAAQSKQTPPPRIVPCGRNALSAGKQYIRGARPAHNHYPMALHVRRAHATRSMPLDETKAFRPTRSQNGIGKQGDGERALCRTPKRRPSTADLTNRALTGHRPFEETKRGAQDNFGVPLCLSRATSPPMG